MNKLCKLLCYGVLIWGIAFVVVSVMIAYEVTSEITVQGITILAVIAAAFLLAKSLNIYSLKEMLKYSVSWVIIGLILDALITARFTGWEFFATWYLWLSYGLLLLVPLLAVKKGQSSSV